MCQASLALAVIPVAASCQTAEPAPSDSATAAAAAVALPTPPSPVVKATLPSGTPVTVMLNQELTTKSAKVGDTFGVTVLHDVTQGDTVVIPQGAVGMGEVTFAADKGGFGRAGMLMIALRTLDLGDRKVLLDGRYREEGNSNNGKVAATWIAVGIFSGFIKGKSGSIPQGRELLARTGEDISFVPGASPPAVPAPTPSAPVTDARIADRNTTSVATPSADAAPQSPAAEAPKN